MARTYRKQAKSKRKHRRRRYNQTPSLPISGFPKQKVVRLRYVQEITLTTPSITGLSKSIPFVANGLYDPHHPASVTDHQPKGFDQWMALYSHYNVLGSKCFMRMVGSGNDGFLWGVTRTSSPNELDGKSLEYILESRMTKGYAIAGGYARNNNMPTSTTRIAKYSQKQQFGKNATSTSELIGTSSQNPAELSVFECWMVPAASSASSYSANFIITIDYIALFTEPKILPQS